jgi:hypothetical protein
LAINKGIAKLRKYYPKTRALNNRYKALYLSLILNPWIKSKGLSLISLTLGLFTNIKNKLEEEYKL